jgi:hypothetical protein
VIADLYSAIYQLLISYHTHIPAGSLNPSGSYLWGISSLPIICQCMMSV